MTARPIHVFRAPLLLGAASSAGLIVALVADGWGDALAWLAVGLPVAIVLWYLLPGRQATLRAWSVLGS